MSVAHHIQLQLTQPLMPTPLPHSAQIRKIKFRTLGNVRKAGDDLDAHLNSTDTEDEARPARQGNNYGLHGSSMNSYGDSFGGDERGGGGAFGCR